MLKNEMYVVYQTQTYVIKSTAIKYDGVMISNEVTETHLYGISKPLY